MQSLSAHKGTWQSLGYGWLLELDDNHYRLLHASADCLVEAERGTAEEFAGGFELGASRDDALSLYHRGDITRYDYRRIDALPSLPIYRAGEQREPLCNFDYLWQQFHEHYAFFSLRGVDWNAVRDELRPRVSPEMPDPPLLYLFERMLKTFNDGHVSLETPSRSIKSGGSSALLSAMRRAFGLGARERGRAAVASIADGVITHLLAPFAGSRGPVRTACNNNLLWCELTPGIGYLAVLRLHDFVEGDHSDGIPRDRGGLGRYVERDIAELGRVLESVFADLSAMRAVIVDLRINSGGFDRAARMIAGHFAAERRLGWQKRAVCPGGFTPVQHQYVEPRSPAFTGPVRVLTSPLCVSAGEIMTLCLRALPQVVTVGEPTAGILSDNLIKPLPNGWVLSLSNEIYEDGDGLCFEAVGIPPDRPTKVVDEERFVETARRSLRQIVVDQT